MLWVPKPRTLTLLVAALLTARASASSSSCLSLGEAYRIIAAAQARVEQPVPGLYASIPVTTELSHGRLRIRTEPTRHGGFRTELYYAGEGHAPGRALGNFTRAFNDDLSEMGFDGAELVGGEGGAPSFIDVPGVVPLVEGRGVPTQAFVTLQQMRLAGVEYGSLRTASTEVGNRRTILELWASEPVRLYRASHPGEEVPAKVLSQGIRSTHTFRYIETVLTQSGHRIRDVRLTPGSTRTLAHLIEGHSRDPAIRELVAQAGPGADPRQSLPWGFLLTFELEPYSREQAAPPSAPPPSDRVETPIRGLYDSIPAETEVARGALRIRTSATDGKWTTHLNFDRGKAVRKFSEGWLAIYEQWRTQLRESSADFSPDDLWRTLDRAQHQPSAENQARLEKAVDYLLYQAFGAPDSEFFKNVAERDVGQALDSLNTARQKPQAMFRALQGKLTLVSPLIRERLRRLDRLDLMPVSVPKPSFGVFVQSFSRDKREMRFDSALLRDAPSFVDLPGLVPLVKGRGVPTQAVAALHQMKAAGIAYGSLRRATTTSITNVPTILEVWASRPVRLYRAQNPGKEIPPEVIGQAIGATHSARHMGTVLTQSGHRIRRTEVAPGSHIPLSELLQGSENDPALQELVRAAGPFSPSDRLPWGFTLRFDLEPF